MSFVDEATGLRIGLDRILQRLVPLGSYGKMMKDKMKAFVPGSEVQVQAEWRLLESLLGAWPRQAGKLQEIELILHIIRDIRGVVRKACHGYVLEDVDLFEIKKFLELNEQLYYHMESLCWLAPANLRIISIPDLRTSLAFGGSGNGFYLDDQYASGLGTLRRKQRIIKAELSKCRKELQERIIKETGKTFNYLGQLRISKLEGDLLKRMAVHPDLLLAAETYTEVDYVLRDNDSMLELGKQINEYEVKIEAQEYCVRKELSQQVASKFRPLLAACRRLGRLDLLLTKARLARETGWCVPELADCARVELDSFVNPMVSEFLSNQGLTFQPISLNVGDTLVTVITGANMGGKSVSLKSVGLAIAMAQMGLLVPAKSFKFSLREFIYYSQQDEDPGQGLSTFGSEVQSLAKVLPRRDQHGLYLMDEPARGTNPWEGAALVKAIVLWLGAGRSLTLVATHFPGLSTLEGVTHFQVAGLAVAKQLGTDGIKSLQKLMDYSLVPARGDIPRDALKVAAFLGLAPEILERASQELGLLLQEVLDDEANTRR